MSDLFVFLSKFLPLLVYPLGLAFILIGLALFLGRRPRLQRAFLILALLALFLGGNRWVSAALARSLEWRYLPPAAIPQAEAIVLLAGGTEPQEYPRQTVEQNGAADRVFYAAHLYHQGAAPNILLSGGLIDWQSQSGSPTQEMASILELLGVPAQALWFEPDSRNTYESAVFSARMLGERGIHKILLVTSAIHMPRSVKLFEAQNLEVIPVPTDFLVTQNNWEQMFNPDLRSQLIGLIPSAGNLSMTTLALKEHFGILVYNIRGWK